MPNTPTIASTQRQRRRTPRPAPRGSDAWRWRRARRRRASSPCPTLTSCAVSMRPIAARTAGASAAASPDRRPHQQEDVVERGSASSARRPARGPRLRRAGPSPGAPRRRSRARPASAAARWRASARRAGRSGCGPRRCARTNASFTMQTSGLSRVSRSVNARPATIGRSSVLEVRRAHDLVVGRRPLAVVERRVADDRERPAARRTTDRAAACSPRRRCARRAPPRPRAPLRRRTAAATRRWDSASPAGRPPSSGCSSAR